MKSIPFIGIFLFSCQFIFAQSDFRPGYILKQEGDTLKGLIAYREGNAQYTECVFKENNSSTSVNYVPDQLMGYGIGDHRDYVTSKILKDSVPSLVFAHILVSGKATLFRASGILYLKDTEDITYEISRRELGTAYYDGVQYAKSDENIKKGILIWKMNDYPQSRKKIERIGLDAKQLSRLFEEYNAYFLRASPIAKKRLPWTALQLGPVVDFTYSKISNADVLQLGFNVNKKQFTIDKSLSSGVSILFSSPRLSEKIWTHLDILYQQKSFESLLKEKDRVTTFELNYTSITVPITISYHFTRYQSRVIPIAEGGVILATVIKNSFFAAQESISGNEIRINSYQPDISFTPTNLSGMIGLGISYKVNSKLSAIVRARVSTGLTAFNVSVITPAQEYNYSLAASLLYSIK